LTCGQGATTFPYAVWKKSGVFNTTEGNVVDYDYIVAFIAKLSERFRIREIAYDRYGAEKIRRDLEELGAEHGVYSVSVRSEGSFPCPHLQRTSISL
jgi:phage terminase large subunit-like protein